MSSADWLHVDVMDGCFVPNLTIGVPVVQSIRKCTGMFLDVHLMIDKPVRYVEAFAQAGRISSPSTWRPTTHRHRRGPAADGGLQGERAVALRPITAPPPCSPTWRAGHGAGDDGGARLRRPGLLEHQLDTIRQVRALIERYNPSCRLEVDGGINAKTAAAVVAAGADTLVAGSAVYGAAEPAAAIAALRGLTHAVLPPALEKLVEQFARLPGIGRKTAQRLAFFVLSLPEGRRLRRRHRGGKGGHPLLPRVPELLRGGRPVPRLPGSQAGHVGHLRGGRSQGRGGHGALPEYPASITCSTG